MAQAGDEVALSPELAAAIADMLEDLVTIGKIQQKVIRRASRANLSREQKVALATSTSMASNALNRATGLLLKWSLGDEAELKPEGDNDTQH